MKIFLEFRRLSILLIFALVSFNVYSTDVVKIRKQNKFSNKEAHNFEVIQRALEVTELEYGKFIFEEVLLSMNPNRMLKSVADGDLINISLMPANKKWDGVNIPVKIPVRMGLLNYRLLVINKADLKKFENIKTIEALNTLSAGLLRNWITTKVYQANNQNLVDVINLESLFLMLDKQRIDYIPRTIYEVYDDIKMQSSTTENLAIEPSIVLHIPMHTYVYVSAKHPLLAERLEAGLKKLLASGELKDILYKYYGANIRRAKLATRKVIFIDNPNYDYKTNQSSDFLFKSH
ncbi:hypothetical protein [Paraglaciecola sp.]|uniref:hypothetical protein n=1 Tax=Paraglaciecola sp. TaxID=1920173 RepID=UPI003EF5FBE0